MSIRLQICLQQRLRPATFPNVCSRAEIFEDPDWHFGFDMDKEQAVATRRRLLDMCATSGITLAANHLPFPGVGHLIRRDGAYQYLPSPWCWGE